MIETKRQSLETPQGIVFVNTKLKTRELSNNKSSMTFTQFFRSWNDFLKVAKMKTSKSFQKLEENYSSCKKSSTRKGSLTWCLNTNLEQAIKLAKLGWKEHLDEVRTKKKLLVNRVGKSVKTQELTYAPTGTEFDVVKVMQGVPDPWASTHETEQVIKGRGNKLRKVVFNISMSCNTSSKTIIIKGTMVASLIELLESNGFSVALDLAIACDGDGERNRKYQFLLPMKTYQEQSNLPRLLYCLSHPSVLRRLAFSVQENSLDYDWLRWLGIGIGCYGRVSSLDRELQGDLYIDGNAIGYQAMITTEGQINWLQEQMRRQGIVMKGDD